MYKRQIEELYNELKRKGIQVSFSTVYRTLKLLAKKGLARVNYFEGGNMRFEPIHEGEHHDHLICINCGRIIEFSQEEIEKLQELVASHYNFKIVKHRLEIYGYCERCRKKHGKH